MHAGAVAFGVALTGDGQHAGEHRRLLTERPRPVVRDAIQDRDHCAVRRTHRAWRRGLRAVHHIRQPGDPVPYGRNDLRPPFRPLHYLPVGRHLGRARPRAGAPGGAARLPGALDRERGVSAPRRASLRQLVERREGLVVPGAYDALSARLVEQAGFPAVYMTGFGVSASRLGLPDLGFAGLAEMADQARNLAAAVSIPLIADADTGYGSALQVRRTVQQYEAAGVAALHIEDQVAPKRCGHLSGKQVVPVDEFAGRIRAAVDARTDPDLLIIARTDAIAVTGFEDAVDRAAAAARAGADVLFVEAPTSDAEIEVLPRRLDRPLLFNYAPSGRTPLVPFARLRELGYAIVILPVDLLFVATRAMQRALAELRDRGAGAPDPHLSVSFQEFLDLIGLREHVARGQQY